MSSSFILANFNALRTAGTTPIPMMRGSTEPGSGSDNTGDGSYAQFISLFSGHHDRQEPASFKPEAFPAVTVRLFEGRFQFPEGFQVGVGSGMLIPVDDGRTFSALTSTGTISSSNQPFSMTQLSRRLINAIHPALSGNFVFVGNGHRP